MRAVRWMVAIGISVAALSLATSGAARAEESAKDAAKRHYKKGLAEYNLGHFDEAIKEFEDAYRAETAPVLLFNIAQAHRQARNPEKALFFYKRYLAAEPNPTNRPQIEARMAELEKMLQEQEELNKREPTSLSPSIGGSPATSAPTTTDNTPGTSSGENAAAPSSDAAPAQSHTAAATPAPIATPVPPPPPVERTDKGRGLRLLGYGGIAAGVACIGVGIAFGVKARSEANDMAGRPVYDASLDDSAHSHMTLQSVLIGAGAVVAAGGILAVVLGRRAARVGEKTALVLMPQVDGQGGFGTALMGSF